MQVVAATWCIKTRSTEQLLINMLAISSRVTKINRRKGKVLYEPSLNASVVVSKDHHPFYQRMGSFQKN